MEPAKTDDGKVNPQSSIAISLTVNNWCYTSESIDEKTKETLTHKTELNFDLDGALNSVYTTNDKIIETSTLKWTLDKDIITFYTSDRSTHTKKVILSADNELSFYAGEKSTEATQFTVCPADISLLGIL